MTATFDSSFLFSFSTFFVNRLWTETKFFADSKRNNKIFVTDIIKHIIPQKITAGCKKSTKQIKIPTSRGRILMNSFKAVN